MQRPCVWRSQAGHWRPGERSRCDPTLVLTPGRPWRTLFAFLRRDLLERDSRRTQVSAGSARAMTSPGSKSGRKGSAEPVARVLGALRHLAPCRRRPGRSGPKWPRPWGETGLGATWCAPLSVRRSPEIEGFCWGLTQPLTLLLTRKSLREALWAHAHAPFCVSLTYSLLAVARSA